MFEATLIIGTDGSHTRKSINLYISILSVKLHYNNLLDSSPPGAGDCTGCVPGPWTPCQEPFAMTSPRHRGGELLIGAITRRHIQVSWFFPRSTTPWEKSGVINSPWGKVPALGSRVASQRGGCLGSPRAGVMGLLHPRQPYQSLGR